MHVTAQDLQAGDRIRGIGITVKFTEPRDDWYTSVEGNVGRDGHVMPVQIDLPNEHRVNVRREFKVGGKVTVHLTAFLVDDFGWKPEFGQETNPYVTAEIVDVDAGARTVTLGRFDDEAGEARTTVVPFVSVRHAPTA